MSGNLLLCHLCWDFSQQQSAQIDKFRSFGCHILWIGESLQSINVSKSIYYHIKTWDTCWNFLFITPFSVLWSLIHTCIYVWGQGISTMVVLRELGVCFSGVGGVLGGWYFRGVGDGGTCSKCTLRHWEGMISQRCSSPQHGTNMYTWWSSRDIQACFTSSSQVM